MKTEEEERAKEKVRDMEILMVEMFDSVSAMKKAYVRLQEAHCPWDPEKMRVADVAVVAELRRLGRLRERFRRGGGGGGRGLDPYREMGMGMVVGPYEAAVEELKSEVRAKEAEVEGLKERLRKASSSKGRFHHSHRRVSCVTQGQAAAAAASIPTQELFVSCMKQVKEASKSFTSLLLSLMRSAQWDIAATVRSIVDSTTTTSPHSSSSSLSSPCSTSAIQSSHHAKHAIESYINRKIFGGFENETFYLDGSLSSLLNPIKFRHDCFSQFSDMKGMDPAELLGILPNCHFGKFCSNKYLAIVHPKMEESLLGNLELNRAVQAGAHPRTEFYAEFLRLAKAVWLLHLLAFALDPAPSQFEASRGAEFHPEYMESVIRSSTGRGTAVGQNQMVVGFPVSPGFKLGTGSVIKARVFLVSRPIS